METRLENLGERLRSSYWLLPSLLSIGAALLAAVTLLLDAQVEGLGSRMFPSWYPLTTGDGARAVLATVGGSMITVAGVAFSILLVALSLASSQFGPRLINEFLRDRGYQAVLGAFIAIFLYCLLVLRTIDGDRSATVPQISVTVAVALALVGMGVFIFFIHHAVTSIRASHVVALVGRDLDRSIVSHFAEAEEDGESDAREEPAWVGEREGSVVQAERTGYLLAIAREAVMAFAAENDLFVRFTLRPGDFVSPGEELARWWAGPSAKPDREAVAREINGACLVGRHRTSEQDLLYRFDQLSEVAIRALSPSLNDPFTAITCIDWICAALAQLARRPELTPYGVDSEGAVRVRIERVCFRDALESSIRPIWHYGSDNPYICRATMQALLRIANVTTDAQHLETLQNELDRILFTVQSNHWHPSETEQFEAAKTRLGERIEDGRETRG